MNIEKSVERYKKSIHAKSVDDYIKLPKTERTVNGWWYRNIASFTMDSAFDRTEPDKYYKFLKKEFPVQYFFREYLHRKLSWYKFYWSNTYYDKIRPIFAPQNTRLRNIIPRTWSDITELIPNFLFECLKKFKEEECDNINWESDEPHKKFYDELQFWYSYITIERDLMSVQISNSYPPRNAKGTYEELYGELNRLEEELKTKDTECLTWIINNREAFWS